MAVDFGVFVPQGWRMDLVGIGDPCEQYEAMTRVAKVADETGAYDSVWVYDHFHTIPEPTMNTVFEAWTTCAGLARDTRDVRIGQMVTCNGYRNPALLAKMASTVDVMSNGRLICGVGVGWWEEELTILGVPFKQRGRHADEILKIFKTLWTSDHPTFEGEFFRFGDLGFQPKPVQKPHPPIWVGGNSPGAFRRVVTYGDGSARVSTSCARRPMPRSGPSTASSCRCEWRARAR